MGVGAAIKQGSGLLAVTRYPKGAKYSNMGYQMFGHLSP